MAEKQHDHLGFLAKNGEEKNKNSVWEERDKWKSW